MGKLRKNPVYSKFQLQKAFTDALSQPKKQRKKWKKPSKIKIFTGVRKAALKSKCTSQLGILAKPLPHRVKMAEKKESLPLVRRSALLAKPTPWNLEAALPKLKHISLTKARYYHILPSRQQDANKKLHDALMNAFREKHPAQGINNEILFHGAAVHKKCCIDVDNYKHHFICELSLEERKVYLKRMILMSQPKPKPSIPQPNRGKKKKLSELSRRVNILATPNPKVYDEPRNPFAISPAALSAICSSHLAELARHREPKPPAPVYDFRGNEIMPPRDWDIEARRHVVASQRTEELATPKRVRAKKASDEKEDAFRISPAALKAVCSERLAELAKPVHRD